MCTIQTKESTVELSNKRVLECLFWLVSNKYRILYKGWIGTNMIKKVWLVGQFLIYQAHKYVQKVEQTLRSFPVSQSFTTTNIMFWLQNGLNKHHNKVHKVIVSLLAQCFEMSINIKHTCKNNNLKGSIFTEYIIIGKLKNNLAVVTMLILSFQLSD